MTERLDVKQYYKIFYNNPRVNCYNQSPLGTSPNTTYFNQHGISGDRKSVSLDRLVGIGYKTGGTKTNTSDEYITNVERIGNLDTFGTGFLAPH